MVRSTSSFAIRPEDIRLSRDPAHLLRLFSLLGYDVNVLSGLAVDESRTTCCRNSTGGLGPA